MSQVQQSLEDRKAASTAENIMIRRRKPMETTSIRSRRNRFVRALPTAVAITAPRHRIPRGGTLHDNCTMLEEQGGISMFRKLVIAALGAMAVLFSTTAFAQG